jgi:hypothetical protein
MLIILAFSACIEPYDGPIGSFEDTLVVNALLTNENKKHQIRLNRSYKFDEDGPTPEENAVVSIIDGDGTIYDFEEITPGIYRAINAFAAEVFTPYYLSIQTENGNTYRSDEMELPKAETSIDDLYADRITDDNGEEGIGIYLNSYDPFKTSNYYRYEYIETFKVIAPFWSAQDAVFIIESTLGGVESNIILREQEERVCYGTGTSNRFDLINTSTLSEDRITQHNIRFISRNDYILRNRYSILVRQFIHSAKAFEFYETLDRLTENSTDPFSEDQPGFLAGNIFSQNETKENVAGFFDVATVAEKRIFFNWVDFFPGEEIPPYFINCEPRVATSQSDLLQLLTSGNSVFFDQNGGLRFVPRPCGDCTALGSNKIPEFWVD